MKRDYKVYLQDILECIERIEEYVGDMSYEDFIDDQKTVDAVIRNIEIIGEATKHIPDTVRNKYLLPWRQMAGMRDKIIHGYFDVVYSIVWETAIHDLPLVKPKIREILDKE